MSPQEQLNDMLSCIELSWCLKARTAQNDFRIGRHWTSLWFLTSVTNLFYQELYLLVVLKPRKAILESSISVYILLHCVSRIKKVSNHGKTGWFPFCNNFLRVVEVLSVRSTNVCPIIDPIVVYTGLYDSIIILEYANSVIHVI